MEPIGREVLWILLLILLNSFFSAAEIAVVSVRRGRARQLAAERVRGAGPLERLQDNPDRFFATIQIGVTVVSALAAAIGGARIAHVLARMLSQSELPYLQASAGPIALGIVVATISFLTIVVGELVPKSLALRYAEPLALRLSRIIEVLGIVASPAVAVLTAASNVVLRPLRDRTNFAEARISPDEIRQMLEEGAQSGSIEPPTHVLVDRALELQEITVGELLVPRSEVVVLSFDATWQDVAALPKEELHSRLPVVRGSLDDVIGYVTARDLLRLSVGGAPLDLAPILRDPYFVPASASARDVLHEMRTRRTQLAFVVDEYGGVSGLVTAEDVLEELVGEIVGEDEALLIQVTRNADGTWTVAGDTPIRKLERELEVEFDHDERSVTVGGFVTSVAGRLVEEGDAVEAHGFSFTVLRRDGTRPAEVLVRRRTSPPAEQERGEA